MLNLGYIIAVISIVTVITLYCVSIKNKYFLYYNLIGTAVSIVSNIIVYLFFLDRTNIAWSAIFVGFLCINLLMCALNLFNIYSKSKSENTYVFEWIGVLCLFLFFVLIAFILPCLIYEAHSTTYESKLEKIIYTKTERIELISLNTGIEIEGNMHIDGNLFNIVGSGYVESNPVYFFYHRNTNGGIIRSYVTSDSKTSQILDVLSPEENAYLEIVNNVLKTTNNNVSPAQITEKIIETKYNFYVPKISVSDEFELNLH